MKNIEEINTLLKLITYYAPKSGNQGGCYSKTQYEARLKKEALEKRLEELTNYLLAE